MCKPLFSACPRLAHNRRLIPLHFASLAFSHSGLCDSTPSFKKNETRKLWNDIKILFLFFLLLLPHWSYFSSSFGKKKEKVRTTFCEQLVPVITDASLFGSSIFLSAAFCFSLQVSLLNSDQIIGIVCCIRIIKLRQMRR